MSELEISCAIFMGFIIVFGSLAIYFTYGMLAGDIDILRERYYNLNDKLGILCKRMQSLENENKALRNEIKALKSDLKDDVFWLKNRANIVEDTNEKLYYKVNELFMEVFLLKGLDRGKAVDEAQEKTQSLYELIDKLKKEAK